MKKLILLDRDGVINAHKPSYVKAFEEFQWISGSNSAIKMLAKNNLSLGLVTNQAGVGKGVIDMHVIESIENEILISTGLQDKDVMSFYYCFHLPEDNCACRKPKPGNLIEAMEFHGCIPQQTVFVGDNLTDYYAAKAADVDFCLVRTGLGKQFEHELKDHIPIFDDLAHFTKNYFGEINGQCVTGE